MKSRAWIGNRKKTSNIEHRTSNAEGRRKQTIRVHWRSFAVGSNPRFMGRRNEFCLATPGQLGTESELL
jgi:hypothetical protein